MQCHGASGPRCKPTGMPNFSMEGMHGIAEVSMNAPVARSDCSNTSLQRSMFRQRIPRYCNARCISDAPQPYGELFKKLTLLEFPFSNRPAKNQQAFAVAFSCQLVNGNADQAMIRALPMHCCDQQARCSIHDSTRSRTRHLQREQQYLGLWLRDRLSSCLLHGQQDLHDPLGFRECRSPASPQPFSLDTGMLGR